MHSQLLVADMFPLALQVESKWWILNHGSKSRKPGGKLDITKFITLPLPSLFSFPTWPFLVVLPLEFQVKELFRVIFSRISRKPDWAIIWISLFVVVFICLDFYGSISEMWHLRWISVVGMIHCYKSEAENFISSILDPIGLWKRAVLKFWDLQTISNKYLVLHFFQKNLFSVLFIEIIEQITLYWHIGESERAGKPT